MHFELDGINVAWNGVEWKAVICHRFVFYGNKILQFTACCLHVNMTRQKFTGGFNSRMRVCFKLIRFDGMAGFVNISYRFLLNFYYMLYDSSPKWTTFILS